MAATELTTSVVTVLNNDLILDIVLVVVVTTDKDLTNKNPYNNVAVELIVLETVLLIVLIVVTALLLIALINLLACFTSTIELVDTTLTNFPTALTIVFVVVLVATTIFATNFTTLLVETTAVEATVLPTPVL